MALAARSVQVEDGGVIAVGAPRRCLRYLGTWDRQGASPAPQP